MGKTPGEGDSAGPGEVVVDDYMHIAGNGPGASIFFWRNPENATIPRSTPSRG
jgi:hypothetical protein